MKNGIIGAFLLLTTLFAGCYVGYKVADSTYVELDGEYLTRYQVQEMLNEAQEEDIHA
jgi:hypothetical protein